MKNILVLIMLLLSSCYVSEDDINPSDVVILQSTDDTILADGASKTILHVYLPYDTPIKKRSVTLESTKGKFVNNTANIVIEADSVGYLSGVKKRIGSAVLQSDARSGKAMLTAKADRYLSKTTIDFSFAAPQSIKVATNGFSVMASFKSEILLTAQLSRETGTPSSGSVINFQVQDSTGANMVGPENFREGKYSSDDTGKASVIYSPGNALYRGLLNIIASVPSNPAIKADSVLIYLYDYEQ